MSLAMWLLGRFGGSGKDEPMTREKMLVALNGALQARLWEVELIGYITSVLSSEAGGNGYIRIEVEAYREKSGGRAWLFGGPGDEWHLLSEKVLAGVYKGIEEARQAAKGLGWRRIE
jgi:hypothetical protein